MPRTSTSFPRYGSMGFPFTVFSMSIRTSVMSTPVGQTSMQRPHPVQAEVFAQAVLLWVKIKFAEEPVAQSFHLFRRVVCAHLPHGDNFHQHRHPSSGSARTLRTVNSSRTAKQRQVGQTNAHARQDRQRSAIVVQYS